MVFQNQYILHQSDHLPRCEVCSHQEFEVVGTADGTDESNMFVIYTRYNVTLSMLNAKYV